VAAVGVTLTAASRVYLFEPCLDPATEAQAAGRIHRLGQTKEIHVLRLGFKNSIEQTLVEMHQATKTGEISTATSQGKEALRQLFRKHQVHAAHQLVGNSWKEVKQVPLTRDEHAARGIHYNQYAPAQKRFEFTMQQCACCGSNVKIAQRELP